jgi:hypothetical protein
VHKTCFLRDSLVLLPWHDATRQQERRATNGGNDSLFAAFWFYLNQFARVPEELGDTVLITETVGL